MPRLIEQLTEAKIRSINAPGLNPDGRSLCLQVRGSAWSWIFRFTMNGRTRDMGRGSLSEVGLVHTRRKAAECRALRARGIDLASDDVGPAVQRALRARGIDPIEHAKAERSGVKIAAVSQTGPTFRDAAEAYMDERLKRLQAPFNQSLTGKLSFKLVQFPQCRPQKDIPEANFWSFTVYDNQTRSMLDTPQRYPRAGSQSYPSPAAEPNTDGSTTVNSSPTQPAGVKRGNWIQTCRARDGLRSCASTAHCRHSLTRPGGRARSSWCANGRIGAAGQALAAPMRKMSPFGT